MSLLEKASIITTPTAYGVGVLNSIKPAIPFGEELISCGNFECASPLANWTNNSDGTISIVDNKLKVTNVTGRGRAFRDISGLVVGQPYQLFVGNSAGTLTGYAHIGSNFNITLNNNYTFIADNTTMTLQLGVASTSSPNDTFFDNLSLKQITNADFDFTRTSSATRVNPDYLLETVSINSDELVQNGNFSELSSELITNGDFINGLNSWTYQGDSITIVDGAVRINRVTNTTFIQQNVLTSGKTYLVEFDVLDKVDNNGTFIVRLGSNNVYNVSSYEGTRFSKYITSSGVDFRLYSSSDNGVVYIDNISVKQVDPNNNWIAYQTSTSTTNKELGLIRIDLNSSNSNAGAYQENVFENGKKYKIVINAKGSASFNMSLLESNGAATIATIGTPSLTTEYQDFLFNYTGTGSYDIFLHRLSSASSANQSIFIKSVSVIEIQENGVPRLDYTNGTASILIEPQSTNLIPYSSDFSQWSLGSGTTVESGYLSPDGTNNAYKVSGGGGALTVGFPIADQTQTRTIYAKTVSGTGQAHLCSYFGNTNNLFTITDQWQRFEVNGTTTPTGSVNFYGVDFRGSTNLSEIIIWGAQTEVLTYATSYIPTSGSAVTRAAETLNNAGNSDLINSTEGVLYAEVATLVEGGSNRFLGLSDGSSDNRVVILYTNAANKIRAILSSGGTKYVDKTVDVSSTTDFNKVAIKYKANDFALWIDGVEVATDTSLNAPVGLDRFDFLLAGSNNFYGKVKSVAVFKEALSDTELACLTSTNNREIFLNYYYRMQYVGANTEALSCAEQTFNI